MPEPADVNLDELKRRARRRLVGAVVLALAAAVFVPMLLESDPRPLGDDVAVKIPPVDDGKFVNRLYEPKSKGAPAKTEMSKSEPPKSTPSPETPKSTPSPETPKSTAPPADASKSSAKDSASEPVKDAGKDAAPASTAAPAQNKTLAEAEQRVLSPNTKGTAKPPPPDVKVPPIDAPKSAPPPAPAPAPKAEPPPVNGAFVVQLAAFIDDKGANALAAKLKKSGYEAYTEPLTTSRGTLWRVRVGPFPTREAAVAVRDKLKNEGQNGIVAAK